MKRLPTHFDGSHDARTQALGEAMLCAIGRLGAGLLCPALAAQAQNQFDEPFMAKGSQRYSPYLPDRRFNGGRHL